MRRACLLLAAALLPAVLADATNQVPVGTYLYANPANPEQFEGRLTVRFATPGDRLVIAWGRRWRKDRQSREGTVEAEREVFKPYRGQPIDDGAGAIFWNLPIDRYDIVVIDDKAMTIHEGVRLMHENDPEQPIEQFLEEVRDSLGPREDRIGGWEGFFDHKRFERIESDGVRAGVFLQQMRLGRALAESGAVLQGCIHSVDVVWVERAKVEGVGWQVVNRQQLYRDEIPARTFFTCHHVPELGGIRVGTRPREIGPIELP